MALQRLKASNEPSPADHPLVGRVMKVLGASRKLGSSDANFRRDGGLNSTLGPMDQEHRGSITNCAMRSHFRIVSGSEKSRS
jgi:hypothetical protein